MQTDNECVCVSAQNAKGRGGQGRNERRRRRQSEEDGLEGRQEERCEKPQSSQGVPSAFSLDG